MFCRFVVIARRIAVWHFQRAELQSCFLLRTVTSVGFMLHLCCLTIWIVFLKYFFFSIRPWLLSYQKLTTDPPPLGYPKDAVPDFPIWKVFILFFFADISQKALNKSHHVGSFCAALFTQSSSLEQRTVLLRCRKLQSDVQVFCIHPNHCSEPECNLLPLCLSFRRSLSLTFLQLCFTSGPKERPCNVLTVASAA